MGMASSTFDASRKLRIKDPGAIHFGKGREDMYLGASWANDLLATESNGTTIRKRCSEPVLGCVTFCQAGKVPGINQRHGTIGVLVVVGTHGNRPGSIESRICHRVLRDERHGQDRNHNPIAPRDADFIRSDNPVMGGDRTSFAGRRAISSCQ